MDLLNDCGFSFSFSGLLKFYSKAEKVEQKYKTKPNTCLCFSFHFPHAKSKEIKS